MSGSTLALKDARDNDAPDLTLESGRRGERIEISMQVRVAETGSTNARSYLSRDLSIEGLFVRTTHPLAIGTKLQLEFALPRVRAIKIAGEVVRTLGSHEVKTPGEAGMGINFRELKKADSDALRAFLVSHGVR